MMGFEDVFFPPVRKKTKKPSNINTRKLMNSVCVSPNGGAPQAKFISLRVLIISSFCLMMCPQGAYHTNKNT